MNSRLVIPSCHARRAAACLAVILALVGSPSPAAVADPTFEALAVGETTPSDAVGVDSIDDPAIWVDPVDPTRSVVIGADHADSSLSVYDLTGERLQRLQANQANNVDLRQGFSLGGTTVPVLGVAGGHHISFYTLDPATRQLADVTAGGAAIKVLGAHGLCLYRSPLTSRFYAFVTSNQTDLITQYELNGDSGAVTAKLVRTIDIHPRVQDGNDAPLEPCAADDAGGSLFVGEHDWHIWRYGAEPTDPAGTGDRVMVDSTLAEGGHFAPDVEGMTVVETPSGERFLMASSQGDATFNVYRAAAPYEFVRKFKVVTSATADGCDRTDGIAAAAVNLGPAFPQGIFVCQDNHNVAPAPGAMNLKFVRLETVLPADSLTAPAPAPVPEPEPQPQPQPQPEPQPQPQP
ncbi:MAG: phytase, partial [Acidimicrobiia bacterium]